MVSQDWASEPTLLQMIVYKANKRLAQRKESSLQLGATVQAIVKLMLHITGFALLTYAAYRANVIAGFAVAGISCFLLSWLATPSTPTNEQMDPMADRRAR